MAFCVECGAKLADGAKFCTFCGAKQPASPPAEQTYTPPVQQTYTPPVQQTYTPPVQQTYTPPVQGYDPADGVPPTKKRGGKTLPIVLGIVAILIVVAVALVLILGGGNKTDDPNLGVYNAVSAQMMGIQMDIGDIYADGFSVELKSGGKCVITVGGVSSNGRWDLDDHAEIEISGGGLEMEGSLMDGRLTIEDLMDSGLDLYFTKDGVAEPAIAKPSAPETAEPVEPTAAATPESTPTPAPAYLDWWRGDWYGWWIVGNITGVYEDWQDNWWDCSARINVDSDGAADVVFWDEYDTESQPTASFTMNISESGAVIGSGFIMDMSTYYDCFVITTDYLDIENLIRIDGRYTDSEGSFDFSVFLRPWGQIWDDWYAIDDTCLPYYYEGWYLPEIEAGASMPGEIPHDLTP